ncbi:MAG: hypothetical protein CMM59_15645 [Rhodospirillaceae bacterium]|nr:hypothetical protein [Rhodospirillaceae bacterium]
MAKNAVLILIDALRYDAVEDPNAARLLTPNIYSLMEGGFVRRAIANGCATHFALPSVFTQTFPLDHGGYNNGIRERPKSFVELLKAAGFDTHLMAAANALGRSMSYERGFNVVHTAADYRYQVGYRIDKTLLYELELAEKGERDRKEATKIVAKELDLILKSVEEAVNDTETTLWPAALRRLNRNMARNCPAERALLARNPGAVMDKLRKLPTRLYWQGLGKEKIGAAQLFFWRLRESLNWRTRSAALKIGFPMFPLGSFQVVAREFFGGICKLVRQHNSPWFYYIHVMDVHDCRSLSRPFHALCRLKYLPRWLAARRRGKTKRKFLYDSALMYVDEHIGKFLETLDRLGLKDDTLIVATGDHGYHWAESPRSGKSDLGFRSHYEDIDVPILVSGADIPPSKGGLLDSMSVAATLLEGLCVASHPSFKGISAFAEGKDAIITENAGRGNADLSRRDLYFTITTRTHKLFVLLRGHTIETLDLYDLVNDPREMNDLSENEDLGPVKKALLGHLFDQRHDLMAARGVTLEDYTSSSPEPQPRLEGMPS